MDNIHEEYEFILLENQYLSQMDYIDELEIQIKTLTTQIQTYKEQEEFLNRELQSCKRDNRVLTLEVNFWMENC